MTSPRRDRPDRLTRMEDAVSAYRGGVRPRAVHSDDAVAQRLTAAAAGVLFLFFLVAFGLFTVTQAGTAQRIIARALPPITEVDQLLAIHLADLQAAAKASGGSPVRLQGYPVDARLTPAEITKDSAQTLQLLLDARAARAVYDRGAAAFAIAGGRGASETGPVFSGQWTAHEALSLLNARSHARFGKLALALAALTFVFVALFCLQVASYGRLVGIGVAGLFGALLAGVATFFVWLVVQFYYSGAASPLASAAWGMIADMAWTMVLIDVVALLCSLALVGSGLAFAALDHWAPRARRSSLPFDRRVSRPRRPLD